MSQQQIDPTKLKRKKTGETEEVEEKEKAVAITAGTIEKIADLAFNASRDKIREVTVIDRMQGRMFPLLDVIHQLFGHCLEIATYRQDPKNYAVLFERKFPKPPDVVDEFMYRTAQWQKSVQGTNLTKMIDIVLAETETRGVEEEGIGGHKDLWGDERP